MDIYINNYDSFNNKIIYNFELGQGGIGDCIKFFMFILEYCMKNNIRLYYKKNNIELEKYIKLKYDKMYINEDQIKQLDFFKIVVPQMYYSTHNYNYTLAIKEVFNFTSEVKLNCKI